MAAGQTLILVGAGGHGRVALDAARAAGWTVAGFIDRDRPAGSNVNGYRVLGDDGILDESIAEGRAEFIVALGDQAARRALSLRIRAAGGRLARLIHPAAVVSGWARIGEGTVVMAAAVINANAEIGDFCIVNTGAIVEHDCRLRDGVQIGPGACLAANVRLETDALVGAGATLIPGVCVGAGSVIGAGAAVIEDLPAGVTAVGVPARIVGHR